MSIIKSGLFFVFERFPDSKEAVKAFYRESEDFQSLCEDYQDCLVAWHHWRQATSEDAPALCQSYAELLQELEQEVRDYLEHEYV